MLLGRSLTDLQDFAASLGQPKFRGKQLYDGLMHGAHSVMDINNVRRSPSCYFCAGPVRLACWPGCSCLQDASCLQASCVSRGACCEALDLLSLSSPILQCGQESCLEQVPSAWRQSLAEQGVSSGRSTIHKEVKAQDGTTKFLLRLADNHVVETVGIPLDDANKQRLTVCVSSQVSMSSLAQPPQLH